MGVFPSGQRGQTVNLLSYDYDGSNPSAPTKLRQRARTSKSLLFVLIYTYLRFNVKNKGYDAASIVAFLYRTSCDVLDTDWSDDAGVASFRRKP